MYFGNDGGVYRTLTSTTGLVNGGCSPANAFQNLSGTIGSMTEFGSSSRAWLKGFYAGAGLSCATPQPVYCVQTL